MLNRETFKGHLFYCLQSYFEIAKQTFKAYFPMFCFLLVVSQEYSTRAGDVYVIIGNSALMKCDVPSFVADFVSVNSWVDNQGQEHFATNNNGISNNLSNMGHTINRSKRIQSSHFFTYFIFQL